MRSLLISAAALLAFGASSVVNASPQGSAIEPTKGVICLDVGGASRPATCQGQASRLDQRYDLCLCENAQRVEAPICGKGERPITENRAYERARKDAARDGSLFGDLYEGRRMCVRARNG
ncbi:MAG: hypothetical protein EON95_15605 [Caulobacteraceae bacterium]|nr:hypothetical protein [Caulobacter sp.]RYF91117.1 MAG: hypothetical protein EON95_15605 [Caulobacteraceae bacterium]